MANIELPEYVRICGACNGTGEYEQNYNLGCGQGFLRSTGACELCGKHKRYGRPGPGFVYKATGEPVGDSVVAQIENARRAHG
jgi:hypothetical protein